MLTRVKTRSQESFNGDMFLSDPFAAPPVAELVLVLADPEFSGEQCLPDSCE